MKTTIILFITMFSCCYSLLMFRLKRDQGQAFEDTGGPVASKSKNEAPSNHHPRPKSTGSKNLPCRYLASRSRNRIQRSIENGPLKPNWAIPPVNTIPPPVMTIPPVMTTMLPSYANISGNFASSDGNEKYGKFLEQYRFKNSGDEEHRTYFMANLNVINQLNTLRSSLHSAVFGVTKYSDLTFEKFSKLGGTKPYCGQVKKVTGTDRMKILTRTCSKFNWSDHGVIPEVREQDQCGSCYAMSTADLIGSQNNIENKRWNSAVPLSAQYIIDCLEEPAAIGCVGGRPKEVITQLTRSDPVNKFPLETCYPYKDVEQKKCPNKNICTDAPEIPLYYAEEVDATGKDEMSIMASMLQWGPLVAIVGLSPAWQFYNGTGIITEDQCDEMGNHAVLVTGYDYTKSEAPYYIVKNSWGSDWGDKGYVKIEAGKNVCDIGRNVLILCTKHCNSKTDVQKLIEESNNPECRVRNMTPDRSRHI